MKKLSESRRGQGGRLGLCPDGGGAAGVVHRVRAVRIAGCILPLGLARGLARDSGLAGFASISLLLGRVFHRLLKQMFRLPLLEPQQHQG